MSLWLRRAVATWLLYAASVDAARVAVDESGLLPWTKPLSSPQPPTHDWIKSHWQIADGYCLYRMSDALLGN